jgi:O-antigen/teichoic acid export membrane protein
VRIGQSLNLADHVTEDVDYQRNRREDALRLRRRGFGMYYSALAILVVTGCVGIALGGVDLLWWIGGAASLALLARAWRDYQNATFRGAPELTRARWILAGAGLALAVAVYIGGPVVVVESLAHIGDDTTL